ncbi:MAG: coenzyme F420-0:L-glutamate ligase [Actinomycetota bacterium]
MKIEVIPIEGLPEIRAGDNLAAILGDALAGTGVRDGDIVCVTQKVVSKAEGRLVPAGGDRWVERETRRVVARRGDLVIAETHHGFVCANAGVDASNLDPGFLSLLPEDPDGTAEWLRKKFAESTGAKVGAVVTDTFGRPWRRGVVNVAIGCAGLPALVDLRGTPDARGRTLETTVVALADEIAAASGLAMGKAEGVPAAIVRGARYEGAEGAAADLIRPPEEDLFRESPLQSIASRRSIRTFGPGSVPREAIEEAVRAACTAPAPHHSRPWMFVAIDSAAGKRRLLGAMAAAWRRDLESDRTAAEVIDRRLRKSDALLGAAPVLIVPAVRMQGAHSYPDEERASAESEMFLLSAGAAIQNLLLALHAQGLASCWVSATLFCKEETREALDLGDEWLPVGAIAAGPPPDEGTPPRPPLGLDDFLRFA